MNSKMNKAKRLEKLLKDAEKLKKIYSEIDELTLYFVKKRITAIKNVAIRDNFALKNTNFKTARFCRYEATLIDRI